MFENVDGIERRSTTGSADPVFAVIGIRQALIETARAKQLLKIRLPP